MWAKLWDMSHLFVCFVALVIQGGAMAKFWPLHHYNQCMGENGIKTLSTARGREGVSTWYFHQIQVGMWAKLWDMSHLFVCLVALVIDIFRGPSCGRKLTYETIFISVGGP